MSSLVVAGGWFAELEADALVVFTDRFAARVPCVEFDDGATGDAHPRDGVVQAVVSGLSHHSGALVAGYLLCLTCLAIRHKVAVAR